MSFSRPARRCDAAADQAAGRACERRRIITTRSALPYTGLTGREQAAMRGDTMEVAVVDPGHVGTVTAALAGPPQGP